MSSPTPSQEGRPEMEAAFAALGEHYKPWFVDEIRGPVRVAVEAALAAAAPPAKRGRCVAEDDMGNHCINEHYDQEWPNASRGPLAAVVVSSPATPARHPGDEGNPAIDALKVSSDRISAASPAETLERLREAIVQGACGVEGCIDCRPLYDANNEPIAGTE